jgi:hypothetical protein
MMPFQSLCAILAACLAATAAAAAPRIACDEPVYRFGRLPADGPETTHTFTLRNAGDQPLELGEIISGCGCAVTRLEHRILMPGAKTTLEVRLNLRGRSGRLEKDITVRSNDPKTPVFRLGIQGDIESVFALSPTAAMFGTVAPDLAATQTVTLTFPGAAGARVTAVTTDTPWLAVSAAEAATGRAWRVTVRTVPPYPAGATWLAARVHVTTTDRRARDIVLPATATVMREAMIAPSELILIEGESGPVLRYVLVRPGSAGRLRITAVETPDPAIRSEVRTLDDGSLQVAIRGIPVDRSLDGRPVILRTDPPAGGPHAIPFRFVPKAR